MSDIVEEMGGYMGDGSEFDTTEPTTNYGKFSGMKIVRSHMNTPIEIDEPNLDEQIDKILGNCIIGAMGKGFMYDEHKLKQELTALIATQIQEAYRKGFNDNARDCYCWQNIPESFTPHKHLLDDGKSHDIRPDIAQLRSTQ